MIEKKKADNYLDWMPKHNSQYLWNQDETGRVTIQVVNKGIFHTLAQKLLGKPAISYVHLDELGSFLWLLMDGTESLGKMAEQVEARFGEEAQPLYPRLVKYVQILESYGFIHFT